MRKYLAEFIGTGILVFFGCGSAVAANALFAAMGMGLPVAFTTLVVAVAFGLGVMVNYYFIGDISGAHINPAVSLGMLLTKRMNVKDFVGYVIAQLLGSIGGAALLMVVAGGRTSLGTNGYDSLSTFGVSAGIAFLIEVIMTMVFVSVVLAIMEKEATRNIAGIVMGLAFTMVYIFGVPFTGASANPARSFGPALLQEGDALGQVWLFIVAPLIGAIIAAAIYMILRAERKPKTGYIAETADTENAEAEEIEDEEESMES